MDTRSLKPLLAPRAIAVVGASQRGGRGAHVIANLHDNGFAGAIYGVNPRYQEVQGFACYPSVGDLPAGVDCIVAAVSAEATCEVLEQAHAKGIPGAVVLAAGFGEGGIGEARAQRLRSLAAKGLCICGPNCFGFINVKDRVAAFSGPIARPLRPGAVAIVSQSGGLGATAFTPLMAERQLGFAYFVSCGNQLGATIEDFVDYFVDDPDVEVVAIVIEALKNPQKLAAAAVKANRQKKSLLLYQAGRSSAGQMMIRSHTGALAGNNEVLAAFLRRCGVVQARSFDEFVEAIELFAVAPRDTEIADDVIVLSGSGGGAAVASDALEDAEVPLAQFDPAIKERLRAIAPDFASVTNPLDATGAMYDDPELLPKIFATLTVEPRRPAIAASVTVRGGGNPSMRRLAGVIADAARASGRTFVAYQYSPLGGPLDAEMIATLHGAKVPILLGTPNAMRTLRYLPMRRACWARAAAAPAAASTQPHTALDFAAADYLTLQKALVAYGIPVAEAVLASSEDEAIAAHERLRGPVAVKITAPGLMHKSDMGGVRLNCATAGEVAQAYRDVMENARRAGLDGARAIVQPMHTGVTEAYAGIIDDGQFGPAICFGLGGVFVEIFKDVRTEMAPLSHDDALAMIRGIKGAPILFGARGRPKGDIEALADFLVRLGDFALAHAGRFAALDLNPVIVKPAGQGVVAVDIALEAKSAAQTSGSIAASS
ncbi:MAG TPA: acetate--CoA ligase family protein [Xanthobacteraceae bacterium]|nr:acetate--CoA ligase family protein [Xanthobacteraceae bacterium]